MSDRFEQVYFKNCNLADAFFDSLKQDYEEFPGWFERKAKDNEKTYVYEDNLGICAFMYLKDENEELVLQDRKLPKEKRIKIGTLKLNERIKGKRLGEGAIGVALWRWQQSKYNQIYVTVFEHHIDLVGLLKLFGFSCIGKNMRGESVFIKERNSIDYSNPYKAFPFINSTFNKAGYIPIEEEYHDTLFPYSTLARTDQETEEISAANGISKTYIGFPSSQLHIKPNEPVLIYRKYMGDGPKKYKSVVSSFATVSNVIEIKRNGHTNQGEEEFIKIAHNKTVFDEHELRKMYHSKKTIVVVEMVYNGFFGAGNNVNYDWLQRNEYFNDYPYNVVLSKNDFIEILEKGGKDVSNIIIN